MEYSLPGSRPWDCPGKKTEVGCHALLQGIFLTQGSNPRLLNCRRIPYSLSRVWGGPEESYVLLIINDKHFNPENTALPSPSTVSPGMLAQAFLTWCSGPVRLKDLPVASAPLLVTRNVSSSWS